MFKISMNINYYLKKIKCIKSQIYKYIYLMQSYTTNATEETN